MKISNLECLNLLKGWYGRDVIKDARYLCYDAENHVARIESDTGRVLMEVSDC